MSETADLTLRTVFQDYKRSRILKPRTLMDYEDRMQRCFSDWLDRDLRMITKDEIEKRHKTIRGQATANSSMKTLKAIYNFARAKYEDSEGNSLVPVNPVLRLSAVGAWFKDRRRTNVLHVRQLKPWFEAVNNSWSPATSDYMKVVLLTGMRRSEARYLTWENVDLRSGVITLLKTKNGDDRSFPVSDYTLEILQRRREKSRSDIVFEHDYYPGYLSDRLIHDTILRVREKTGFKFMLHDLRRTYISVGDEIDEKVECVKVLVGHRAKKSMTETYVMRSMERLRLVTQRITDAILQFAEQPPVSRTQVALLEADMMARLPLMNDEPVL